MIEMTSKIIVMGGSFNPPMMFLIGCSSRAPIRNTDTSWGREGLIR